MVADTTHTSSPWRKSRCIQAALYPAPCAEMLLRVRPGRCAGLSRALVAFNAPPKRRGVFLLEPVVTELGRPWRRDIRCCQTLSD